LMQETVTSAGSANDLHLHSMRLLVGGKLDCRIGVNSCYELADMGSNLAAFIDPPATLIVIVSTMGMLLLGGHSISAMLKSAISGDATPG
jgi:hypothetical protein